MASLRAKEVEIIDTAATQKKEHLAHLQHLAGHLPERAAKLPNRDDKARNPQGLGPEHFLVFRPTAQTKQAIQVHGRDNRIEINGTIISYRDGFVAIIPPDMKKQPWAARFLR